MHPAVRNIILLGGSAISLVGASALLAGEVEGMAIDATIDNRGMVAVKDASTPGNNVTNIPIDEWLTNSTTSPKLVRKADGTYGWSLHNLLTHSQQFDNAAWPKTRCDITPNATIAPNGTQTAFHHVTNAATFDGGISQTATVVGGLPYTISIYAKQAERAYLFVRESIFDTTANDTWFDLANGVVATKNGAHTASIEDVGGGWYRCIISVTPNADRTAAIAFYNSADDLDTSSGEAGDGIYVWGAQLNRGSVVLDYFPTTTAARFAPALHVDPTHGQGLLVEPQATNLLTECRNLADADWTKSNVTATRDVAGIDGISATGSKLVASANNATVRQDVTSASAERITSIFARRRAGTGAIYLSQGETDGVELAANGGFDADTDWTKSDASVTIAAGVLAFSAVPGGEYAQQALGAGTEGKIYRLTYTISNYSAGGIRPRLYNSAQVEQSPERNANGTYVDYIRAPADNVTLLFRAQGTTTCDIDDVSVEEVVETELDLTSSYQRFDTGAATITNPPIIIRMATSGDEVDVDFVQQEASSVPTSPIETAGAQVTRAADDVAEETGKWPLGQEFSWYQEVVPTSGETGTFLSVGGSADRLELRDDGSNGFRATCRRGGGNRDLDGPTMSSSAVFKIAARFKDDDWSAAFDGSLGTDTSNQNTPGAVPVDLYFGSTNGTPAQTAPQLYLRVVIVPRAWSDTELQQKTAA